MTGCKWAAMVMAFVLAAGEAPGPVGPRRPTATPENHAVGTTMTDATFEDLAGQVVRLYEAISKLARDATVSQAEKQKRRSAMTQEISLLIKRMHESGRNFYAGKAYLAWRRQQNAESRRRRLGRVRTQLNVTDDDEWRVLAPQIDLVLQAREQYVEAEKRTQLWSPPETLRQLRAETAKSRPEKKRLKALLGEIRLERTAARREVARLRALLDAAQRDLISILTLKQEAALVLNQVID